VTAPDFGCPQPVVVSFPTEAPLVRVAMTMGPKTHVDGCECSHLCHCKRRYQVSGVFTAADALSMLNMFRASGLVVDVLSLERIEDARNDTCGGHDVPTR
jgi:hypothetical protein